MQPKTAVITGASKGIGKAVAEHLSKAGYTLLLIARNAKSLELLKESLGSHHEGAAVDVTEFEKIHSVINKFIEKYNHIDVVFNSAGYVKRGTSTLSPDEFHKMIMTNLTGFYNVVHAASPSMKQHKKGYIFSVASYSGKIGRAPLGGYAASKFGVVGFGESLYKELASYGISVTTICPNLVDTEMTADVEMQRDKMIPVSDIVKTVDYLLNLSNNACVKEVVLQCRERIISNESY